jgi:DNA ligase-1
VEFKQVAEIFEQIGHHKSRIEITKLLARLFEQANAQEARILSYLFLGMVRPPYEGTQFNLAQKSVSKVIATLLGLSLEEVVQNAHKAGDLGLLVLEGSWISHKKLSVEQVYEQLLDIESKSGVGSQEKRSQIFLDLLRAVDPLSACYLIRIVIGKLRLGFSDMTIIDGLSWMIMGDKSLRDRIEHTYNICADIGIIAWTLKEKGEKGLDSVSLQIGIPIRLAAAERLPTAQAIFDKIGVCVVQPKLDGFRLQVHIDNRHSKPNYSFFSRNLQNMSNMFPELLEAFTSLPVETLIVEGEAIAYDPETDCFVPFQETAKRKRKHGIADIATELPLRLFLFDLLYLNGESFLDKSEKKRRELLLSLYPVAKSSVISTIPEQPVETAQELERYFLRTVEVGLEGVMVKKPSSHYQAGKRNFNWIKLKRQEEGHLEDTLDTVILGYYFGQGKRVSFGIGAFLVGVYDEKHDRFETIAKVGTGLKDADWQELKRQSDHHKVTEKPSNVVCAPELEPDVWVAPEIVCLIRADEITLSPLHAAGKTAAKPGFALRFPRFMGYRPDKRPEQATTVDEVRTLYEHQKITEQ